MPNKKNALWFYSIDGKRIGPLSSQGLKQAANNGKITESSFVLEGRVRYLGPRI